MSLSGSTAELETPVIDSDAVAIHRLGEPLPIAVKGERTTIAPHVKQEIERLSRRNPRRFLWQLSITWTTIAGIVTVAVWLGNPWVTALAVCLIATRQNVLGLLMHEQCHRLGFRSKIGDQFCNLTVAYPLLVTLEGYRRVHLAHHQSYFTGRDPDYRRKQGPEWTFPQRARELASSFLRDLTGLNLWHTIRGKGAESAASTPTGLWQRLARPAFYVTLAGLLTWFGLWQVFALYWLLPLATVLQVIVRWGAICEHRYNLIDPTVAESTPIIIPRWWESLLLPNLNFTLHIYHHWYPRVPYAKLPELHELFRREGLVNEANVFRGYGEYLAYLLGRDRTAASQSR